VNAGRKEEERSYGAVSGACTYSRTHRLSVMVAGFLQHAAGVAGERWNARDLPEAPPGALFLEAQDGGDPEATRFRRGPSAKPATALVRVTRGSRWQSEREPSDVRHVGGKRPERPVRRKAQAGASVAAASAAALAASSQEARPPGCTRNRGTR
jgi:hypothetical protein